MANETKTVNYYAWRIGQQAYVKFGSRGKQLAECRGFNRAGQVLAKKYSAKSKKWTKTRIVITEDEFLNFA